MDKLTYMQLLSEILPEFDPYLQLYLYLNKREVSKKNIFEYDE